jgi:hypothetical protein
MWMALINAAREIIWSKNTRTKLMTDLKQTQSPRTKWLWGGILAVLAFVLVAVLFNPSGDRDGTVQDPIVIEDFGEGIGLGASTDPDGEEIAAPAPIAPGSAPDE